MPKNNFTNQQEYNPRWFIWTIVFLLVTGVSLVALMSVSATEEAGYQDIVVHRPAKQVSQQK